MIRLGSLADMATYPIQSVRIGRLLLMWAYPPAADPWLDSVGEVMPWLHFDTSRDPSSNIVRGISLKLGQLVLSFGIVRAAH